MKRAYQPSSSYQLLYQELLTVIVASAQSGHRLVRGEVTCLLRVRRCPLEKSSLIIFCFVCSTASLLRSDCLSACSARLPSAADVALACLKSAFSEPTWGLNLSHAVTTASLTGHPDTMLSLARIVAGGSPRWAHNENRVACLKTKGACLFCVTPAINLWLYWNLQVRAAF